MKATGCDWSCSGPLGEKPCETMECCAQGRATIWLELMGHLDSCFILNQHKISFKSGPKISHLYGDEALIKYFQAISAMLMVSNEDDQKLDLLPSILISSTLLDILSQTFLSSPLSRWHFRSRVFLSAIDTIQRIFLKLKEPWAVLNSKFVKSNTTGLSSMSERQQVIVWSLVPEGGDRPNSTTAKIDKLLERFPRLMTDVKDILRNRPSSNPTLVCDLLDRAIYVPICYVLECLFQAAIEMGKQESQSSTVLSNTQVKVPISSNPAEMTAALLDLKVVYNSKALVKVPSLSTEPNVNGDLYDGRNNDDGPRQAKSKNERRKMAIMNKNKENIDRACENDVESVREDRADSHGANGHGELVDEKIDRAKLEGNDELPMGGSDHHTIRDTDDNVRRRNDESEKCTPTQREGNVFEKEVKNLGKEEQRNLKKKMSRQISVQSSSTEKVIDLT